MKITNVKHRGLRRLIEAGDPSGLPAAHVSKVDAILGFLAAASGIEAVQRLKTWKAHQLTGDRKGTWSLSVNRNWRITFRIGDDAEVMDLDFEDYH